MDAYADLLGSVPEDGQRILRLLDCEGRNSSLDRIEQNRIGLLYYVLYYYCFELIKIK